RRRRRWISSGVRRSREVSDRTAVEIEQIFPLAPLQEGLLFHSLYDRAELDVYTAQVILSLDGALCVESLRAAAHGIVERHRNLAAAFVIDDVRQPVQIIPRAVTVPWKEVDLS